MTDPIDTAYVEIRADGSRFGSDVASTVDREMRQVGRTVQDSVTRPVNGAVTSIRSSFSNLGTSISNGLRPGVTQVQNFRAGFESSEAAASAFTGRMGSLGGQVRSALNPAITSVQNFHSGLASSDAAASAFTGRMGTLGGAVGSTFRTSRTVVQDFGSITTQVAGRVGSGFSSAATQVRERFTSAFAMVRSQALLLGGVLGAGGIGALLSAGFSRISDIEQTTKSLEVMTGSASRAKDVMTDLLTFARSTPFAFPDISQIGRNLISFGIDTNKVIPIMKALGDAASASGRGTTGLQSLGTIIGQIASKGKLQGDELLQLAENGIPALRILANTAGKSTQDMSKAISKGQIDSNFAIDALVKGIENGTNGIAGQTARMGGIMASQKDTIVGTMDSFKSTISSTMATLLTPAIPLFRQSVGAIGNGFKQIPVLLAQAKQQLESLGFFDAVKQIFNGIRQIVINVWPIIQTFVKSFAAAFGGGLLIGLRALGAAFQWLGGMIKTLQPVLQPIAVVLGVVWGATMLLRGALMAGGAAMLVWKGIMIAFGPIMKIFTALQWALNVAMDANPISLIVLAIAALVAAFVILWNKSAGFRLFWIGLWQAISSFFISVWNTMKSVFTTVIDALKDAWNATWKFISDVITAVWTGFLKPVFDAITTAVRAVGTAASWLWTTILQPVFNFIAQAAIIMGKIVLGLVLIPLVAFFRLVLAPAALWLWHNVIEPVWDGISTAISLAWTKVIKPTIDLIVYIFTVALPAAAHWVADVLTTVWHAIGDAISWVVNNILKPLWEALKLEWKFIETAALWLWHNVITPVFDGIGNAISWVINNILKPLWESLKLDWKFIEAAALWLWHNVIEPVWNGISNSIKWVWDNVIHPAFEAIKTGVHAVGDAFSAVKDAVKTVWDQLGDIAMKPIRFIVNTVLDDGLIAGWNKVVDFLKLDFLHIPAIPRLAVGGIIPGYTPGRDTHVIGVGGGEAVMRPEWTRAAGADYVHGANAAARTGGVRGASAFIARNGLPGFADGGIISDIIGSFLGGALGGVGIPRVAQQSLGFDLSNPGGSMRTLLDKILAATGTGGFGNIGKLVDLITQAPKSLVDGMVKKIQDAWNAQVAVTPTAGVSGDRAINKQIVHNIFAGMFGWGSPVQLAATDDLIMGESGYNNTAQNPTSTAYGIFQFLDSTWGGYGIPKTADPTMQAIAGGRYIRARYGDPIAANIFKHAHNWYRAGGIAQFATGGVLQPGQFGFNETGKPEAVLNGAQWKLITQNLDITNAARELLNRITSGGSFFEDFSFYGGSQNLDSNNDLLASLYYGGGGQFNASQIAQFLTSITTATAGTTRAASEAAAAVHDTHQTLSEKLDEMIALLRQRQTVGVTVALNGKVLDQWFTETEILGGL